MSLSISAMDLRDPNIQAIVHAEHQVKFPSIVLFYRSEKQAIRKYGKNDDLYDSSFGFDTYIPKLYGTDQRVIDTYKPNNRIQISYPVQNRRGVNLDDIYFYPPEKEMEMPRGAVANDYRIGHPNEYRAAWLNIPPVAGDNPDNNSVTLSLKIEYPPNGKVNQEYLNYKQRLGEDFENVNFKIVAVDVNFIPLYQDGVFQEYANQVNNNENQQPNLVVDDENQQQPNQPVIPLTLNINVIRYTLGTTNLHNITINKTGKHDSAALVAYYIRRGNDGRDIELLLGQVNILASQEMFTLPIQYVKIRIQDIRIRNNQAPEINLRPLWQSNTSTRQITNGVNTLFKQVGICFDNLSNRYKEIIINLVRRGAEKTLVVDNSSINLSTNKYFEVGQDGNLLRSIKNLHIENIMNVLLNPDQLREYKYHSSYKTILNRHPFLNHKKDNSSLLGRKHDKKIAYEKAKIIVNLWFNSMYTVYLLDEVNGGDYRQVGDTSFWTNGYAYVSGNEILMYKKSFDSLPVLVPHELGHCLSLQHTFNSYMPFVSHHVDFTSDWDTDTINRGDLIGAVGSTFDNVMDYDFKNNKFFPKSFTKHQWDGLRWKSGNIFDSVSLFSDISVLNNLLFTLEEKRQWGYRIDINALTGEIQFNDKAESLYNGLKDLFREIFG